MTARSLIPNVLAAPGEIGNPLVKPQFTQPAGIAFGNIILTLWNLTLIIAGLVIFIYFVWGSLEWLTAGGDSEKVKSAQKRFTNAIIGLAALLSIIAVLKFVLPILGINIFCPIDWSNLTIQEC